MDFFLVFLFILVPVILFLFVIEMILAGVLYIRFLSRNRAMEELARGFSLSFHSFLPSFPQFFLSSFIKDSILSEIKGSVSEHSLSMREVYYSHIGHFRIKYARRTIIIVDGKTVEGKISNLTLGSTQYLASISELRNFLEGLRSNIKRS